MLGALGFVLEFLLQRFGYIVLPCSPFAYMSLVIMFIAVTRWNLWGLLLAPLMAFATVWGGSLGDVNDIAATYNWQAYISILCGHLMFGVNYAFYRKDTSKIITSNIKMIGIIVLDYILFNLMQLFVYRLLTSNGDLFHQGVREVVKNSNGEIINVVVYGERGFVYNLFAFLVMLVGAFVFRSQGVVCNVKQKFIDDKRNAELDRIDTEFSIEEAKSENPDTSNNSTDVEGEDSPIQNENVEDETTDSFERKKSSED